MKAFLFSIGMLVLLVALLFVNTFFVIHVTDELHDTLSSLPTCALAETSSREILTEWESKTHLLELSVSATDLNELSNHLITLCTAARQNDEKAFELARALALEGVARIRDLERFRFLHIL